MREQEKDMWMFGKDDFLRDRAEAEKRGDVFCDELGSVDYLGRIKSQEFQAYQFASRALSRGPKPKIAATSAVVAPLGQAFLKATGHAPGCVGGICHWDGPLLVDEVVDEPTRAILRDEGVIK